MAYCYNSRLLFRLTPKWQKYDFQTDFMKYFINSRGSFKWYSVQMPCYTNSSGFSQVAA